ncbi:hypothetical protein HanPI659440_Chr03g0104111 [Helianthus annuus]|nr:hypothetical protein HanPI659440_Chr03g0104111 [Helianthus annuus]
MDELLEELHSSSWIILMKEDVVLDFNWWLNVVAASAGGGGGGGGGGGRGWSGLSCISVDLIVGREGGYV